MKNKRSKQSIIKSRVINEAHWYIEHKSSVRDVAENFMIGKSTVHLDLRERLKSIDYSLYGQVSSILDYNRTNAVNKMNRVNELRRALGK